MKKLKSLYIVSILFLIFTLPVSGQQKKQPAQYRQAPAPVTAYKINENIYEVRGGSGSNSSFIIGGSGVIVIDAKMTDQSAKDMIDEVKKITDKPVTTLILTHSDGDHVNGMTGFPEDITIISHANAARDIKKENESGRVKLPYPNITFSDKMPVSNYKGDQDIILYHFGPAHTDGDIVIYIPEYKTAMIGDLFFKGMDPLIHKHKNGSSEGFIKVLQKLIDLDAECYLSGHAEPVKKDELESLRSTIIEKRNKVKGMIASGKNLDAVKKAFGIPAGPSRWPSLAEIIYNEMTLKK